MCFDTISSSTGLYNDASTLLQQIMDKELLSLACRHHVTKRLIGAVFQECMGHSSASKVPLFKRFKAHRGFIDVTQYMPGIEE